MKIIHGERTRFSNSSKREISIELSINRLSPRFLRAISVRASAFSLNKYQFAVFSRERKLSASKEGGGGRGKSGKKGGGGGNRAL